MPEEEKDNLHNIITEGIAQAMLPVYWTISGIMFTVLVIFVSIAWPISDRVNDLHSDVTTNIKSEEVYRNFLTKNQYHFLQKEAERFTYEAMSNPTMVQDIFRAADHSRAEQLEIRLRGDD